jgi:two-component system chemotaxis sensor kinase CheA
LTHLVRNACDHGIEAPEERVKQGKPPVGCVKLGARHYGDQIRITISDDGRGIDREAVGRQAVEQGLRSNAEISQMSDPELFALILVPGFSTAPQVSEVSGRGVGMDVVKTNLAQLGGSVEIESAGRQGTTFTLRLPLTLAIMPSLLVMGGGQRYAIPQKDLEELVCVDADQTRVRIERAPDQEVVRLRGRLLPLVRLTDLLESIGCGRSAAAPCGRGEGGPLVFGVVKSGTQRYALAVDRVLASEEIVVKPMHSRLRGLGLFSGATILGDGRVSLILHTQGLAAAARVRFGEDAEMQADAERGAGADTEPVLMVRDAGREQIGVPVSQLRRLVMLRRGECERLSAGWFVTVDGVPTRLVSIFGQELQRGSGDFVFALLPRDDKGPAGFVVDEVLGTEMVDLKRLHPLPERPQCSGVALVGGKITPIVDLGRIRVDRGPSDAGKRSDLSPRILLVDDTQFFRDVAGGYLASAGYEVITAENGAAALELLGRQRFDLVVSDLEMPVMDGWTLAAAVRREAATRDLPLLALTTLSADHAEATARTSGFDALEVKLDRNSLLASVERLLEQRSGVGVGGRENAYDGSHSG